MKSFLQRSGIVVGGWALSLLLLAFFGYMFARSAPMQAMIAAQAHGGHLESNYGQMLKGMDSWLTIASWVLYPILFGLLGIWVGVLEKIRPLLTAALTIIPSVAFAAASFFGVGHYLVYVLQLALYGLISLGIAEIIFHWKRRRIAVAARA